MERLGMLWVYSSLGIEGPPALAVGPRDVVPVRSLYIDCAPAEALRSLMTGSGDALPAASNLVSIDAGGLRLLAGVQPFGEAKTALHIVLPGGAQCDHGGARQAASAWAEQIRDGLEKSPTPGDEPITRYEAAP
jgi:hypothetical protein